LATAVSARSRITVVASSPLVPRTKKCHSPALLVVRSQQIPCHGARRRLRLQAMIKKLNHRGYYVMATRQTSYPPSWRWRIMRRGKPMGVRIEGGGFSSYDAAWQAGAGELP